MAHSVIVVSDEQTPPTNLFPTLKKKELMSDIQFTQNSLNATNDSILLLDESGSMETLGKEPYQACCDYIQTQYDMAMAEQNPEIKDKLLNVRIKIITFSTTYSTVLDAFVHELDKVTFDYKPSGMTDLYSPLYEIFTTNNNSPKDIVIISDGENNTGPHNSTYIKKQIQHALDAGWTLKFIGCTVESMSESETLGLHQYTSNCSNDIEGAPTLCQLLRSHSEQVSITNRMLSDN